MTDRQGIEIDYCPQCRGVWLDRGELDKIIERSAIMPVQQAGDVAPPRYRESEHPTSLTTQGHDHHHGYKEHGHGNHGQQKKKSLLSELFDF